MSKITELLKQINAREKSFLVNVFMSKGNNREIHFANFMMDIKMYNYTHKKTLINLYDLLYNDPSILFAINEKECDHKWKNDFSEQSELECLQNDSKYIVCTICHESRYVEVDCSLGGYLI